MNLKLNRNRDEIIYVTKNYTATEKGRECVAGRRESIIIINLGLGQVRYTINHYAKTRFRGLQSVYKFRIYNYKRVRNFQNGCVSVAHLIRLTEISRLQ